MSEQDIHEGSSHGDAGRPVIDQVDPASLDTAAVERDVERDVEDEQLDEVDTSSESGDAPVKEGGDLLVLDSWQVSLPATGDTRVDAALSRLSDVDGKPPSEHADVYEAVHGDLHAALSDLDQA